MQSSFSGLHLGLRALMAQRRALDVTGHNIANANNEGYSRQKVTLVNSSPYTVPTASKPGIAGQVGTGVEVARVERIRDFFLDRQYWGQASSLAQWQARRDSLEQVEVLLNEPGENGISTAFDLFWESLQSLSEDPESDAARSVVRQRGIALVESMKHVYGKLKEQRQDVDFKIRASVNEINNLAEGIAAINKEILAVRAAGDEPNDLKDQRGMLLNQLAQLADIDVLEQANGTVRVSIGGTALVDDFSTRRIVVSNDPLNSNMASLTWNDIGLPVEAGGGRLGGMLKVRDEILPSFADEIESFARDYVENFNAVHRTGYGLDGLGGRDFFEVPASGPVLEGLEVSDSIISNLDAIAASKAPDEPGDNTIALELADLKAPSEDFLRSIVGRLGVDAQEAARMAGNEEILLNQIDNQRQSVSGVSLDEEMVNLIKFQHGYNAAARLITVIDEMMGVIIGSMGVVGR